MQDKSTYLLSADSEGEMEDWINTLNKILHSSFEIAMQEKRNGDIHDGMGVCLLRIANTWRTHKNMKWSIILIWTFQKYNFTSWFNLKNIYDLIYKTLIAG